ncbi:MAG TPA: hypothetical protein VK205_10165 [Prolixibacteraceae bacterium]|nr:hypothetical protein [Prolixibacteraceae bacterium]
MDEANGPIHPIQGSNGSCDFQSQWQLWKIKEKAFESHEGCHVYWI